MSTRSLLVFSLGSLVVGFGLGLAFRPAPISPSAGANDPAVELARSVVPEPKPVEPVTSDALPRGKDERTWAQRRGTLLWLQEVGVPMRLNAFQGREPSKALGAFLELTPAETTAIRAAVRDAGDEIDRLRAAHVVSRPSDDGTQWVVEIPALEASASAAIYDAFHSTVKATLGDERFALLNVVAGDSLERGFDRYGLNEVRYEINLLPKEGTGKGEPAYNYKRHTQEAGGLSKGWTGGSTSLAMLVKQDPLLERFLPPVEGAGAAR